MNKLGYGAPANRSLIKGLDIQFMTREPLMKLPAVPMSIRTKTVAQLSELPISIGITNNNAGDNHHVGVRNLLLLLCAIESRLELRSCWP